MPSPSYSKGNRGSTRSPQEDDTQPAPHTSEQMARVSWRVNQLHIHGSAFFPSCLAFFLQTSLPLTYPFWSWLLPLPLQTGWQFESSLSPFSLSAPHPVAGRSSLDSLLSLFHRFISAATTSVQAVPLFSGLLGFILPLF